MTEETKAPENTTESKEVEVTQKSLIDPETNDDLKEVEITEGEIPEGLDEKFWDAEKKEIKVNDLTKAYLAAEKRALGLRKELSKGKQKAPEAPENYAITFDDIENEEERKKAEESINDTEENELLQQFKKAAYEAGLSQEQFNKQARLMNQFLTQKIRSTETRDETDEEFETRKQEEYKAIGKNAEQIIRATSEFVNNMEASGDFTKEDMEIAKSLSTNAAGIKFLNRVRMMRGGDSIDIDRSSISDGLPSDREIAAMYQKMMSSSNPVERERLSTELEGPGGLLDKRRAAGRPDKLQF